MGLKGSLNATPFPNVLTTLASQSATGLLRVNAPDGTHFLEFADGLITVASRTSSRNPLGELLIARGLISEDQFTAAINEQKSSGLLLGEVLLRQNAVTLETLETMLRFQVEEEIYDLFETFEGEFEFLQGAHLDKQMHATKGLVRLRVTVADLAAEAQRRADDWKNIRERVPDSGCLMNLTPEGSRLLAADEGLSVEGKTILRQVALRRSADAIALKACLGRYNTYRMMMELADVGLLQPATPQEYLQAADNAIGKQEYDEARRLASTVSRFFPSPHKEHADALLKRLQQKFAPKTTSARVMAPPGATQELNRRGTGRAVMEAQPSRMPLIAGIVAVILIGGGVFWFVTSGGKAGSSVERLRLDQVHNESMEAITAGNLGEGLEKIRSFTSTDPEVMKLAKDLLEKRQRDVDTRVDMVLNDYSKAQNQKDEAVLQVAVAELQRLRDVPVGSKSLDDRRAQYLNTAAQRQNAQRTQELMARLAPDFTAASKGLTPEQIQRLEAALFNNPPETILDSIAIALTTGTRVNREAARLLERGKKLQAIGEFSAAQAELEKIAAFPGAPGATEAAAISAEMKAALDSTQNKLKSVQTTASQGKAAEALKVLLEVLANPHPAEYRQSALDLAQSLEKAPEKDFAGQLNTALLLYDKDPDASRKQTQALLERAPYSKAAGSAALRLNVTSFPEGATVFINGRMSGKTPALVAVPALGGAWISVELEGFEPAEKTGWNLRDTAFHANLQRLPTSAKRIPFPATGGMDAGPDRVVLLGTDALAICNQAELKNLRLFPLRRVRANAENVSPDPFNEWPPVETPFGGALALTPEGALYRASFTTGQIQKTQLQSVPIGPLAIGRASTRGNDRWIVLPTRIGMESYDLANGTARKALSLGDLREGARAGCAVLDGIACFARDTQLHVVNLETGLAIGAHPLGGEASGVPLLQGTTAVVPLKSGALVALNFRDGKQLWKHENAAAILTLQHSGPSIVIQRNEGSVELLDFADGAPHGTLQLQPPTLPLALLQNKGVLTAFATTDAKDGKHTLTVSNGKTPQPLWRTTLAAKPVALAAHEDALFVSLETGELLRFDLNYAKR